MSDAYRRVDVVRVRPSGRGIVDDDVAVEEPLEVRLHGRPFAVIMRTPGADRALAAGFLFAEGVVRSAAEVGAVEICRHPDYPDAHNVVDVYLLGEAARSIDAQLEARRNVVASSSCGMCGRVTIDALRVRAEPMAPGWTLSRSRVAEMPELLRSGQPAFDRTGGLHGAALIGEEGGPLAFAEDVGRHNAVDKIVGRLLLDERLPAHRAALAVSGRASFEIVQKAWLAGIALVCAVSAPSTLAIELAAEAGITLLGFARDGGFNVYSHPGRIEPM
jgi:FdhD protein